MESGMPTLEPHLRIAGRHSLGTRDRDEAIKFLVKLDKVVAADNGLIDRVEASREQRRLSIADGRKLFDDHNARPLVVGGTKNSTQKRYRAILDKFEAFAKEERISDWHQVSKNVLIKYSKHLTGLKYARKTIFEELTLLKMAVKWLCNEGHMAAQPIVLKLKKAKSQRAYCYTFVEVAAMLELCRKAPKLDWLQNVIIALACTGMRIEELVQLRWSDVRLDEKMFTIADESGFADQSENRPTTKSGRTRNVPIGKELLDVLKAIARRDQFVFHGPRGGRLRADTVRNIFVREVITPLSKQFPKQFENEKSFVDGRLHSFRHYFCSVCANKNIPERNAMEWVGHADSQMVRHYYHLSDEESRKKMDQLNPLGEIDGRPVADKEQE